jgi:hypothetical protein
VGNHIVLESSQCTLELTGETFTQASTFAWKQGYMMAFIFSVSGLAESYHVEGSQSYDVPAFQDVSAHREGQDTPFHYPATGQ